MRSYALAEVRALLFHVDEGAVPVEAVSGGDVHAAGAVRVSAAELRIHARRRDLAYTATYKYERNQGKRDGEFHDIDMLCFQIKPQFAKHSS
jgi:hypothetical protein